MTTRRGELSVEVPTAPTAGSAVSGQDWSRPAGASSVYDPGEPASFEAGVAEMNRAAKGVLAGRVSGGEDLLGAMRSDEYQRTVSEGMARVGWSPSRSNPGAFVKSDTPDANVGATSSGARARYIGGSANFDWQAANRAAGVKEKPAAPAKEKAPARKAAPKAKAAKKKGK